MSHWRHLFCKLTMDDLIDMSELNPRTGCWEWLHGLDVNGYAVYGKSGKIRIARFAWELTNGREMPDDLVACHKCLDCKKCINPEHVYAGTEHMNLQDQYDKRERIPWRHTCTLTDYQAMQVKLALVGGTSCRELDRQYGVSHTTIVKIKNGYRYKDVEPNASTIVINQISTGDL